MSPCNRRVYDKQVTIGTLEVKVALNSICRGLEPRGHFLSCRTGLLAGLHGSHWLLSDSLEVTVSCFGGWNDCYHSKCHIRLLLHLETGERVPLPSDLFCKSRESLPTLTLPLLPYGPDVNTCLLSRRVEWPWPPLLSETRKDPLWSTWSLHPANKQKYLARKKQNSLGVGRQRHLLEYMVPATKDIWTPWNGTCPWRGRPVWRSLRLCGGGVLL